MSEYKQLHVRKEIKFQFDQLQRHIELDRKKSITKSELLAELMNQHNTVEA